MSALEQTLAAEGALLGSLLLDPNMLPLVMAEVGAADFSQPSYRAIFDAIRAVDSGEGWVDVVSVGDELARRDLLDAVGGQEALLGLLGAVPSAVHAERYAREVKAAALRRTLAEVGAQIGGLADADRDVLDLVADAQTLLGKLTERATAQEGRTLAEALADYRLGLDTLTEQRDGLRGVQTGLMDINQITGGWMKSDLIILAARPGVGKTSLSLGLAHAAAQAGKVVALFNLEMPAEQLVQRERAGFGEVRHVRLPVRRQLAQKIAPRPVVEDRQLPLQVAPQGWCQPPLDLATEIDDLADPAAPRVRRRGVLKQQEMLDDPRRPAPERVALLLAQVADLLGQVGEVERQVVPAVG